MVEKQRIVRKRIGELLIERGVITNEQLKEALNAQTENKKLIGEILIDLGYANEEDVVIALTTQFGIPYLPLENYDLDPEIVNSAPKDLVFKYNFLPVDKIGDVMTIVVSDVLDHESILKIEEALGFKIESFLTTPSALRSAIEKYSG